MGELLGIPEWLAFGALFLLGLLGFLVWGTYVVRKAHRRVLARRRNPSRDEFIAMLEVDVPRATAEFLWEQALVYTRPILTPHPDDDLIKDLRIDDNDLSMDWPREFAETRGFHESNLPDWPAEWPATVRNFGRWLESGATKPGRPTSR